MPNSPETIDALLARDALALHYRQKLEPVDGRDVPIYPPTYPAPRDQSHRRETPYTVNEMRDGTLVATLDSIPSQANRMEGCFGGTGDLKRFVPTVGVQVKGKVSLVTELGHRIADAAIRSTELDADIRDAFNSYDGGDPAPLARLSPTALIYGAWDSRGTRVKVPRLIRAEIIANDVDVFTRSAQFRGAFAKEELELDEHWDAPRRGSKSPAARAGFKSNPRVDQHGGVVVRGDIVQSVALHLGALSQIGRGQYDELPAYLLALALAALLSEDGGRNYLLRSGCWLAPEGAPEVTLVTKRGERNPIHLDPDQVTRWLDEATRQAAEPPLSIVSGEERVAPYDVGRATALAGSAGEDDDE